MIVESPFRPAWWLRSAHLQTLWPSLFRRATAIDLRPERLELADGDFLDLAWTRDRPGPLILVIHGLEGSLKSHYVRATLEALSHAGFPCVFMYLRGCSGEPNRLPRRYHSGDTEDLATVIEHIRRVRGAPPDAAVGFSLGGNLLLKYLGERGADAPLRAAVAVSVPFLLDHAARRLEQGPSRIYRNHLLQRLHEAYLEKLKRVASPLDLDVTRLRSFYAFDDQVTAPLHGFAGADDYYARCSSRRFLKDIAVSTLVIHAADDPFMFPETVPSAAELAPAVTLELSSRGGHVGFVSGTWPWRPVYWLDRRIPEYLRKRLGGGLAPSVPVHRQR